MRPCGNSKCSNEVPDYRKKYCSVKCSDLDYYYRNLEERKAYQKQYYHKNKEKDRDKKREYFKMWYQENKEKFKAYSGKNYLEHKDRWRERQYVTHNRDKFFKILTESCENCKKNKVKIISIKGYKILPEILKNNRLIKGSHELYILEYAKYLKAFCSKLCSARYNE